ncbi:uncharacterized protein [Periplaneta americana]|uniref:uncharacterized protein n=1 Tax=Periplaneta americana TaxID=6978 RepID=UPI0037E7A0ED
MSKVNLKMFLRLHIWLLALNLFQDTASNTAQAFPVPSGNSEIQTDYINKASENPPYNQPPEVSDSNGEKDPSSMPESEASHASLSSEASVQSNPETDSTANNPNNRQGHEEQKMRAETPAPGVLFPGLPTFSPPQGLFQGLAPPQGGSANPSLIIGGFSLIKVPMPGMNDVASGMLQNILPLLQKIPAPSTFPNVFTG